MLMAHLAGPSRIAVESGLGQAPLDEVVVDFPRMASAVINTAMPPNPWGRILVKAATTLMQASVCERFTTS
jgi:hypothetical protein